MIQKARPALTAVALALAIGSLAAQQPQPQPPQGRGQGRGGGGMRGAQPINFEDRSGFQSIFDGTMKNWDGDPSIWKAEGNVLVGTTTEANPLKENTFVIWRGGEPADFELKVEYRMSATNSGIQFRSTHLPQGSAPNPAQPDAKIAGKWVLKGYQADIDFANQFTGMIYEERGRGFLMAGRCQRLPRHRLHRALRDRVVHR